MLLPPRSIEKASSKTLKFLISILFMEGERGDKGRWVGKSWSHEMVSQAKRFFLSQEWPEMDRNLSEIFF